MSITANFYNLSKRKNSTLLPTGGSEIPIDIKNGCSVTNPVIELDYNGKPPFNYFYLPNFNRYYFVSGMDFVEGIWIVRGKVDPLSSFKTSILATRCNILYAQTDRNIVDQRIPVKSEVILEHNQGVLPFLIGPKAFILSVTGKGSFGHYVLSNYDDYDELIDGIDSTTTDWHDLLDAAKQAAYGGSAADNIKHAYVFPVQLKTDGLGSNEPLFLGGYPAKKSGGSAIQVLKINNPIQTWSGSISIPWHFSDWRKTSPYTRIYLYLPLAGTMELDTNSLVGETTIEYKYSFNITSGDMAFQVKSGSGRMLNQGNNNIAMDGLYGSSGINSTKAFASAGGLAVSAAALLSGIATGGAGAAAVMGMAGAAGGLISALGGTSQGSAGIGGSAITGLDPLVHIWTVSRDITSQPSNYHSTIGYPYMDCGTLSGHSGYTQTSGFSFKDDHAYFSEIEEINSLMDGGVYIE